MHATPVHGCSTAAALATAVAGRLAVVLIVAVAVALAVAVAVAVAVALAVAPPGMRQGCVQTVVHPCLRPSVEHLIASVVDHLSQTASCLASAEVRSRRVCHTCLSVLSTPPALRAPPFDVRQCSTAELLASEQARGLIGRDTCATLAIRQGSTASRLHTEQARGLIVLQVLPYAEV